MTDAEVARPVLAATWRDLTGLDLPPLELTGTAVLPGPFRVADAAVAAVGCALLAAGRWLGARRASLDVATAAGAFLADRRLLVDGVAPELWDPLAGDHRAVDGWVRLHTNYPAHRRATLRALGLAPADPDVDRAAVAAAVAARPAVDVEESVVASGAAGAALRTREQWRAYPQAAAVAARPLVSLAPAGGPGTPPAGTAASGSPASARARDGERLRVLDLTRVIAGPTATKVLAAAGADVLRLDAPGFDELPALVADTTAGKRCARLDLAGTGDLTAAGSARFTELVAAADVLVDGLRPGALARRGWPAERLASVNPGLVVAELSAYGDTGPWAGRRGFDSLVQTVSGIAAEGTASAGGRPGVDAPVPLPAQARDHASGWLLAAGVLHALALRREDGHARRVGVVLARTGQWLDDLGRRDDATTPTPAAAGSSALETVDPPLGRVTRVGCPGALDGRPLRWAGPPSPLGSSPPAF